MLRLEKRVLTLQEALCSVLSGKVVPDVYDVDVRRSESGTAWSPDANAVVYSMRSRQRQHQPAPVSTPLVAVDSASTKPVGVMATEWIERHLTDVQGVLSCIPGHQAVALSTDFAVGNPDYWLSNFSNRQEMFNPAKTKRVISANRVVFESNMLSKEVPPFVPEGDAFGLKTADTDEFFDAGISVTIRKHPYGSPHEPVRFKSTSKRASFCAIELAHELEMVQRGLAPCILALFFTRAVDDGGEAPVDLGEKPIASLSSALQPKGGEVSALVSVSQISTFNLSDLMNAINKEVVKSKQEHLLGVLSGVCGEVFSLIRDMSAVHESRALVKLNMTPESIVFCPKLVSRGDQWHLEGTGFMPMSNDHLDGVAKMTDFNAAFTTRIRKDSYSPETSYVMHCMLLVAFTRAMHGAFMSTVLWEHLLSEDDPSGFIKDAKAMCNEKTNASAFLAALAASPEMREVSELSKALAEVVSDVDEAVRHGVVADDGALMLSTNRSMFGKLISVVTGSSSVNTALLFESVSEPDDSERLHLRALEDVKNVALRRFKSRQSK